jgi:CBS-domain-containing membrane protein
VNNTFERLKSLYARDVMKPRVITVSSNQTMAQAAQKMLENEITGAPVIDEHGHCVGMLTATDFVRREHREDGKPPASEEHVLVREEVGAEFHIDEVDTDLVQKHMSAGVQTVALDGTLLEVAHKMCQGRIHRLPVLDEHGHPVGIVCALDLIGALVDNCDE